MKIKSILASFFLLLCLSASAQNIDTLQKIKTTGAITLGVRESSGALSYTLGSGQYAGYHVEICQRIVTDIQKSLNTPKLDVRYVSVTSQNRIPLLVNGTIDLECGSTTNNTARQKDVAFAVTTFVEEVRMAVKVSSPISSITQLNGKKIVTASGSTSVQLLRKLEKTAGMNFEEIYAKDHAESLLVLAADRADVWVMDGSILAGNIATLPKPTDYKIVGEVISTEPIAIMLRRDDPAIKKAVDDSIKSMVKSGVLAALWEKWFIQPIPPTNKRVGLALSESTKAAWANPNDLPQESYSKK